MSYNMDYPNAEQILAKYKDQFNDLNAFIYHHDQKEEMLLLKWWMHLNELGDIERLIKPDARSIHAFYNLFKYPTTLIYTLDEHGEISNAGWIESADEKSTVRTAQNGIWTRSDIRGSRKQFNFITLYYNLTFEFFDAILGLTWQPDLLDLHTKLGYNIVGVIPNFYNQPNCYIVHLTRENYQNSRFNQIRSK